MPCFRLKLGDLIKVGRVRFKIREIMSSGYRGTKDQEEKCKSNFRKVYPMQTNDASINDTKQLPDISEYGLGGSI